MLDLLIKNGDVVFPGEEVRRVNIGVKNGKIEGIYASEQNVDVAKILDVTGMHVFPGLLDAHEHLGIYNSAAEDFADTAANAIGGVTTVVNYYREPKSYFEVMPRLIEEGEANSLIDFSFSPGIIIEQHLDELEGYIDKFGLTSFKFFRNYERVAHQVFNTDQAIDLTSPELLRILQRFRDISPKMLLAVHCENMDIAQAFQQIVKDG